MKRYFTALVAMAIITLGATLTSCNKSPYDKAMGILDDMQTKIEKCENIQDFAAICQEMSKLDNEFDEADFTEEQKAALVKKATELAEVARKKSAELGMGF